MAATRRPGEESRALLIEAAAEIIRNEGYAVLTAKRLAEKVGLKRQIVHYYFRTMEDLLLAVVRYYGDTGLARFAEAVQTQDPLRVVWEMETDANATTFAFLAMASHQPVIRAEVRSYLDKFRALQAEAVAKRFESRGLEPDLPPVAAVIIIQAISQALTTEASLGASNGHAETREVVSRWLRRLAEPGEPPPSGKSNA